MIMNMFRNTKEPRGTFSVDDLADLIHPDAAIFWDRDVAQYVRVGVQPRMYLHSKEEVSVWVHDLEGDNFFNEVGFRWNGAGWVPEGWV